MEIKTNAQCKRIYEAKEIIYYSLIYCSPSSKNLFAKDKVLQTKIFPYSYGGGYYTNNVGVFNILANPRNPYSANPNDKLHFFTTKEECEEYITQYKISHSDEIRKVLYKRKKYLLDSLKSINDRIALLN